MKSCQDRTEGDKTITISNISHMFYSQLVLFADTGKEEKLSALHYLHWAQVIVQNKYFSSQLCWNFQSQSHQLCPKCSSVLAEF